MTTEKSSWRGNVVWWVSIGAVVALIQKAILHLVPVIPQRAELWLTTERRIADLSVYGNKYAAIPGEILGTAVILFVVAGLFCKEEGNVNAPRNPRIALSGIVLGSVFSIPLVIIPPYGLAVSVAFAAGFFAMMLVTMEISDHDSLYSGFGTAAGITITTFIVYGGYRAAIAMVILAMANIVGILCGLIIGGAVRYGRKRWL